ncbi:MAG: hypothetical protein K2G36_01840 [Ruminococcus sp.]|nr:hypothetical protein [Ruminococcus sp.]
MSDIILFIGIPAGIVIFFIVSLILLKRTPVDSDKYKKRKTVYMVSSVLAGIIFISFVALVIMISISLTYM